MKVITLHKIKAAGQFGGGRGMDYTRRPAIYEVRLNGERVGVLSSEAHQAFDRNPWDYTSDGDKGVLDIDDVFRGPTEVRWRKFRTLADARENLPALLSQ